MFLYYLFLPELYIYSFNRIYLTSLSKTNSLVLTYLIFYGRIKHVKLLFNFKFLNMQLRQTLFLLIIKTFVDYI